MPEDLWAARLSKQDFGKVVGKLAAFATNAVPAIIMSRCGLTGTICQIINGPDKLKDMTNEI